MNRGEVTSLLFEEIRNLTMIHSKYLASKREYLDGEQLYMREAHFVMAVAGNDQPPTMSELAEKLRVTPGAVSQLALQLEKKGFVIRLTTAEDKRVNIVTLTPKGEALYLEHKAFDEMQYQRIADFIEDYTAEQIQMITAFEQKMATVFMQ